MLETGTAETSHLLSREDIAMEEKRSPTVLFFSDEKYELYLRFFQLIRKNDLDGVQLVLQNGANLNWSEQKSASSFMPKSLDYLSHFIVGLEKDRWLI